MSPMNTQALTVKMMAENPSVTNVAIADAIGVAETTVRRWRKQAGIAPSQTARREDPALPSNTLSGAVETEEEGNTLTARFTSTTPISTKDDAAAKAGVDLTQWTVERVKTKAYQVAIKTVVDGREAPVVQQLWGIAVTFTAKTGPTLPEQIEALVDGVLRTKGHASSPARPPSLKTDEQQQQIFIADPHISKLCWSRGTGDEPYDIDIARKLVLGGVKWLVGREATCHSRVLAFLGDYFHYDTLTGTTTAGTGQDRDSRLPKMLEVGAEIAVEAISYAARLGQVKVIIVPGNHDAVLTSALQRILVAEFRNDGRVEIDDGHTKRKVHAFGRNLFLYDHGDRRKKELAATLAIEHAELWGASTYREVHTGHLHHEADVFSGSQTHHGCIVYTHPSMSPPDQWHADEQYVGATRGMKAFTYDIGGGQVASFTATPRLLLR